MLDKTVKAISAEANMRPYAYSISLDCNAKGYIQPSVKVVSDDLLVSPRGLVDGLGEHDQMHLEDAIVLLLDKLVKSLKHSGYKIATDIEEIKNGKD